MAVMPQAVAVCCAVLPCCAGCSVPRDTFVLLGAVMCAALRWRVLAVWPFAGVVRPGRGIVPVLLASVARIAGRKTPPLGFVAVLPSPIRGPSRRCPASLPVSVVCRPLITPMAIMHVQLASTFALVSRHPYCLVQSMYACLACRPFPSLAMASFKICCRPRGASIRIEHVGCIEAVQHQSQLQQCCSAQHDDGVSSACDRGHDGNSRR